MSDAKPIPCAMTVAELIAELQMHDPRATVVVTPTEGGYLLGSHGRDLLRRLGPSTSAR